MRQTHSRPYEREEAKALMEKKRAEQEKVKEKALQTPGGPGVSLALRSTGSSAGGGGSYNINKGWTRVPKIEMGKRTRANVEALIRKRAIWNPYDVRCPIFNDTRSSRNLKALDSERATSRRPSMSVKTARNPWNGS